MNSLEVKELDRIHCVFNKLIKSKTESINELISRINNLELFLNKLKTEDYNKLFNERRKLEDVLKKIVVAAYESEQIV